MTEPAVDICVIGAGSSGIAVAKALHDIKVALPSPGDMALEVRDFHQKKISTWLNSPRYTLEVDFNDYAGELNGDIAKAASGRPAAA
ncbi:hypothetical protein SAMN03159423_4732 [Bradyrhizobium sp. NFR13]|jgi:cation diffusion facilitator CzcD-associated flavoprotein CzcO|uniref:hypothetical protein n=1 Tax=Bradyrhizobium sp. NFR13 TaxID=1566285 RepID=UPI0008E31208|nr:hypothetical protein [Bradyrhizobium sp. NFR13]SFL98942.1 hypothetical protein SAMN03159423_4732 [Bradyrhizobium sp. NFR13]